MSEKSDFFVHLTAIIDNPVSIGSGTKIWHWVHVMEGAAIGKNCVLGQNVYVGGDAKLGNNVRVQNNVSIYDGVILEDDVFCGPSIVFTNVINPRSTVNRQNEYMVTHVKRGASLGANATVICGNTLGEYCFIGAGSVVTRDVPDYALVVGVPGKQIGWVSKAGLQLSFDKNDRARCPETREEYKLENNKVKLLP